MFRLSPEGLAANFSSEKLSVQSLTPEPHAVSFKLFTQKRLEISVTGGHSDTVRATRKNVLDKQSPCGPGRFSLDHRASLSAF